MKRAIVSGALIAGLFFAVVNVYAGDDARAVFFAASGIFAGAAALAPFADYLIREARHEAEYSGALSAMDEDPYAFSQRVADIFASGLAELEGKKLGDIVAGASLLAASLEEHVRIAKIRRYEELLRSRTWHP